MLLLFSITFVLLLILFCTHHILKLMNSGHSPLNLPPSTAPLLQRIQKKRILPLAFIPHRHQLVMRQLQVPHGPAAELLTAAQLLDVHVLCLHTREDSATILLTACQKGLRMDLYIKDPETGWWLMFFGSPKVSQARLCHLSRKEANKFHTITNQSC